MFDSLIYFGLPRAMSSTLQSHFFPYLNAVRGYEGAAKLFLELLSSLINDPTGLFNKVLVSTMPVINSLFCESIDTNKLIVYSHEGLFRPGRMKNIMDIAHRLNIVPN